MMANELTTIEQPSAAMAVMPAMQIEEALERRDLLVQFTSKILREGHDFGNIPGTNKPTLLKPGAEKLTTFFGLTKKFILTEKEEDWTGAKHGGEPFFFYRYKCQLWRGDLLIAESEGSCNSWESKYRWRNASRVCPECKEPKIIKGKEEFGGGWLCFKKSGGCGAKFQDGDRTIESQTTGKVPNPDIFDQVNTFQKMSQKRALIAATLLAVNASEFFTQDVEDFADHHQEPAQAKKPTNGHKAKPPHQEDISFGTRMYRKLKAKEDQLIKQGTCKNQELFNYVISQGKKWGWSSVIPDWDPEVKSVDDHIYNVEEMIRDWVNKFVETKEKAQMEPEPDERQPGEDEPIDAEFEEKVKDEIPFGA